MVKIIFLGTNGWYDTDTGNTISILIKTKEYNIVLDAGNGLYKIGKYADKEKPVYIFISHYHIDHVEGLHTLDMNRFPKGLNIMTQEGGEGILNTLMNPPFTKAMKDLPFETKVIEVPKDIPKLPFKAEVLPMVHSVLTLGIRIEIDDKIIAYCPDTGYCANAVKLAKGADLVITECAFKPGHTDESWPHLNPETAAKIAKDAGAKKLILTHFDARVYSNLKSRSDSEKFARKIFRNSYSSKDGMEIEV